MRNRIFIAGLCAGAIGMDLINCHLYRLGSLVHWIDILSLVLWPVMLWAVWGVIAVAAVEADLNAWIERREIEWLEKEKA